MEIQKSEHKKKLECRGGNGWFLGLCPPVPAGGPHFDTWGGELEYGAKYDLIFSHRLEYNTINNSTTISYIGNLYGSCYIRQF